MENVGLMVALAGAMTKAPTAEQVSTAVDAWLDDHPEATTTVTDGAITNAKLASSFVTPGTAAAYSSSAKYAVGDYVFYGGTLYRCITAITTAEAWTSAHWTAAVLGDDVSDLKSALTSVINMSNMDLLSGVTWEVGTIDASTGIPQAANNRIRTVDYIDLSNITIITITIASGYKFVYDTYNSEKTLTQLSGGGVWNTGTKTLEIPSNIKYLKLLVSDASNGVANVGYASNISASYKPYVAVQIEKNAADIADNADAIERNETSLDNSGITSWNESLSWAGIGTQTVYKSFKTSETYDFSLTFSGTTSDDGQKNVQVYDDTDTRIAIYYGNVSGKLTVPRNTESLRFVVSRTGTWTGWGVAVSIEKKARTMLQRVYHVEKDGSGDFTKLTDAIIAAEVYENSIVYVGDGTWDVLSELGSDYLNAISPDDKTTWGLYLTNGIHLIFSSNSKVVANYTGTLDNVRTYFSVFNSGAGGFTLENCIIESSNIRYCVHDDPGINTPYQNKYINCRMYHDNNGNTVFGGWQCIGGGFGKSGDIEIVGCYFDGKNQYNNTGGIVSYHNYSAANSKSRLTIRDCYFAGAFTIRLSWFGASTEISTLYACGNSLGAEISHRAENESATVENTAVVEWNNVIRT